MVFFTALGIICIMLACCVALSFPAVLAITVSVKWLWVYAVYAILVVIFAYVITGIADKQDKQGNKEEQ